MCCFFAVPSKSLCMKLFKKVDPRATYDTTFDLMENALLNGVLGENIF